MALKTRKRRALPLAGALVVLPLIGTVLARKQLVPQPGPASDTPLPAAEPRLDAPAPLFTLSAADGSTFRLAEARGKAVVLNFWASWCGPCRDEMPSFENAARRLAEEVVFVGVNATAADSRIDAQAFVERLGITFPIVFDDTGETASAYGVEGLPVTFFIDAAGVLRAKALGPVLGDRLRENLHLTEQR